MAPLHIQKQQISKDGDISQQHITYVSMYGSVLSSFWIFAVFDA